MKKDEIKIFYLLSFLGGLHFNLVAPLFVIFGLSLGFTIAKVGVLFGASRLVSLIFEVPTGMFADQYGRKKSILLTYFLTIFSSLIYFFSSNFYVLLIGSVISGLALTFMSGAFEALAVDSLGLAADDNLRNKFFVRLGILSTIGFIAGGFMSGLIAYFDLRYIWLAQSVVSLVALIIGWQFIKEKDFCVQKFKRDHFGETFFNKVKEPAVLIIKNKAIFLMLIVSVFISLAGAIYVIDWPVIFKDILSIPVYYFGAISSVAGIFFLVGSLIFEKFSIKRGTIKVLATSLILMGIFYVIFGFSKSIFLSLMIFMALDFFNGGFSPLFYSLFNKFIPSPQRATILSFYSLINSGSSGLGEILGGWLIIAFTAPLAMIFVSALVLVSSLFLFRIGHKIDYKPSINASL